MSSSDQLPESDFQRLFAAEAEGRLDVLVDQLLVLEKSGASAELVASLFREAHTIKGGAAVVGLGNVARVTHALEDLLEEVRSERRPVDAALIDAVLAGVDAIRTLIPRALAGAEHERVAAEAEQRLRRAVGATAEAAPPATPPSPRLPASRVSRGARRSSRPGTGLRRTRPGKPAAGWGRRWSRCRSTGWTSWSA